MSEQQFDSNEEMYMDWWLQELKSKGYIKEIIHQPKSFVLLEDPIVSRYFTPYKKMEGGKWTEESIMKESVYTTDIKVIWDISAFGLFTTKLYGQKRKKKGQALMFILCQRCDLTQEYYSYIEVKPAFDQNNMTRLAKTNIKWVWDKYKEYVNIVVPEKHFNKTFTPAKYFFTNLSGKPRKINYKNILTLKEFIDK